jgi:hypothetical protein
MEDKKINKIEIEAIASAEIRWFDVEKPTKEEEKDFLDKHSVGTFNDNDTRTNPSGDPESCQKSPQ